MFKEVLVEAENFKPKVDCGDDFPHPECVFLTSPMQNSVCVGLTCYGKMLESCDS